MLAESLQSCPTLCNLMDGSTPGSVHGILQARILTWLQLPLFTEISTAKLIDETERVFFFFLSVLI